MSLSKLVLVRSYVKFLESLLIYLANAKDKVAEKVSRIQILIPKHIFFIFYLLYVTQN